MWACRDLPRINTSAVLRTYGICHLPLGKRLSLGSTATLPPSSHLFLSDFPSLSLSSCWDLKAWSALVVYCALNGPLLHHHPPPPKLRSVKRKKAQRRRGCWRCEALSDRGWSHHRKVVAFNSMWGSQQGRRGRDSDTCSYKAADMGSQSGPHGCVFKIVMLSGAKSTILLCRFSQFCLIFSILVAPLLLNPNDFFLFLHSSTFSYQNYWSCKHCLHSFAEE